MKTRANECVFCEDCKHPRGAIDQSAYPLKPKVANTGAPLRCGVCGSSKIRELKA